MNVNLHRHVTVCWRGFGGLSLSCLEQKIRFLEKTASVDPAIIIIHCGGNDIGMLKTISISNTIEKMFACFKLLFPFTKIVFSQILSRTHWRYSSNKTAMENARRRINSCVRNKMRLNGGFYLSNEITKSHLKKMMGSIFPMPAMLYS